MDVGVWNVIQFVFDCVFDGYVFGVDFGGVFVQFYVEDSLGDIEFIVEVDDD